MSTATPAPYKMEILPECEAHKENVCIALIFPAVPHGKNLALSFETFRAEQEVTQIGVIKELLLPCEEFRPPIGYVIMDSRTVHLHYSKHAHSESFHTTIERLRERLDRIVAERNKTHYRDPQGGLVHAHKELEPKAEELVSVS